MDRSRFVKGDFVFFIMLDKNFVFFIMLFSSRFQHVFIIKTLSLWRLFRLEHLNKNFYLWRRQCDGLHVILKYQFNHL